MKKIFLFLFVLFSFTILSAQNIVVESFLLLETDLTANMEGSIVYDQNGEKCALIKVRSNPPTKGFSFDVGHLGVMKVEIKGAETWLYVPHGVRKISIQHEQLGFLDNYDLGMPVKRATTYQLNLRVGRVQTIVEEQLMKQFLMFRLNPKDAVVEVAGDSWIPNADGVCRKMLSYGTYDYRVEAKDYHVEVGRVTLDNADETKVLSINLRPAYGWIEVLGIGDLSGAVVYVDNKMVGRAPVKTDKLSSGRHSVRIVKDLFRAHIEDVIVSDNQTASISPTLIGEFSNVSITTKSGAEIWVDGELKGTSSWSGRLSFGEHLMETKLASHRSQSRVVNIQPTESTKSVQLPEPQPIYGSLSVEVLPDFADIYIDGVKAGQTPKIISKILIGDHKIEVRAEGKDPLVKTIVISEGEMSTISGELKTETSKNKNELDSSQQLPIDAKVRIGCLENGLTYYIRHNEQPKERCEFYIAQDVGAILEEDYQNGFSHFLEHMAFNGTKNFPNRLLVNYFESVGVGFGSDINAYTSLDETVYCLSNVPTRPEILDSALLVLHDWSCAISLHEEEIDNERGVIRKEWRTGNTANRRMWREGNKLKYPGSQYAKRDVIGDTAVINNFTYQALRDYYELWYGPDLQCVVIVGDIDVDQMEKKIKDLFSPIPARANRGERPRYSLPTFEAPHVAIYTDKEAQFTQLAIEFLHPAMPRELKPTDQGHLMSTINSLIRMMISYRIDEITMDPNANFIQAMGGYGNQMGETDAFEFIVIPKDGKEKASMADMFTQVEKIKRYGFTASELERAKTDYLSSLERAYNERTTRQSQSYAQEYYRHYLDGEPIPGIEFEYEYAKAVLPQLPVDIFNQLAQAYITDNNIIISYIGKENSDIVSVPTKGEVHNIFNAVKVSEIEAPEK